MRKKEGKKVLREIEFHARVAINDSDDEREAFLNNTEEQKRRADSIMESFI